MSEGFEKRLIPAAEWLVVVLGIAAGLLGIAFAGALVTRATDAIFGWTYDFRSIGDFLGIRGSNKLLTWDRSFLLFAAAVLSGYAAAGAQGFIDWAQKSPGQRQRERQFAREQAKKAAERAVQAAQEKKERRRAAHRPMSGWRRLWIVLSVLFGFFAYFVAHDFYSHASAVIPYNGNVSDFWAAAEANSELSDCAWSTARASNWMNSQYLVTCDNADPWLFAFLWAFAPALIFAAVGLTVRWIYRGFRRPQKQVNEPQ